jgi:hypothetical protein
MVHRSLNLTSIFKYYFYCRTGSVLHADRGYRMRNKQRGNRLPLATAPKVIWALIANWQREPFSPRKRTSQNMKFLFLWVIFALMDPAPDSWSTDLTESGFETLIFSILFGIAVEIREFICTISDLGGSDPLPDGDGRGPGAGRPATHHQGGDGTGHQAHTGSGWGFI